jgi:hypothetical protein
MFIVTKTQVRPNTSVEFFSIRNFPQIRDEFKQYMYETYMSTGKLIDSVESVSANGLTKTVTTTWVNEAAHQQWQNDSFCEDNFNNYFRQHAAANGITISTETQVV